MSAFVGYREAGGLPKAIVISDAGTQEANGLYKATDREYCDAPVYEHAELGADFKITREPHTNPKTGAVKHGWLLGQNKTPLYGVPTESLTVPSAGWKKFNGEAPVPTVQVYEQLVDVFFQKADAAKGEGDAATEKEEWESACESYTAGIDALKKSGERFGDPFKNRAALLLARRGNAFARQKDFRHALRDSIASLELVRGLASAEVVLAEALEGLGVKAEGAAAKILEPIGTGKVLDSGAPLVLRCVERWIDDMLRYFEEGDLKADLPEPRHMPSDRYLDGLDEEQREAVIKKYLPEYFVKPGGTGILHDPKECLAMMNRWEQVFSGAEFQQKRKDLWDVPGLGYVGRLQAQKKLVCEALTEVLEPMGFAPGQPGLTRVVRQMQVYWSQDKACADKALDLEELADVSLADLE